MNCKHVQELLPLYVSRDLEEKRARQVTAHVRSCVECAVLADEYSETRQLLENFTPPQFSEAVYDGIRQRVLREIEREAPKAAASSLPQLAASLFRPRLSWAVATVLLLAISVFAFYFIASRENDARRQSADVQSKTPPAAKASSSPSVPAPRENNGPPFNSPDRDKGADTTIAGSADRPRPSQGRKRPGVVADRQTAVAANTPYQPSITTAPSPEHNNLAEPDGAASAKTLRVEMQTKDPNIRIIWFSPQRTKQVSPGKFSKGV